MNEKIHILENPIFVTTTEDQNDCGILPRGTVLYYKETFDEGFDRFCVYLNVEGDPLLMQDTPKENFIDPLIAYPRSQTKHDCLNMIKEIFFRFGLTQSDLSEILSKYPSDSST